MNKKEDINTITNEMKNVLLKAKKEVKALRDEKKNKKRSFTNQKRVSDFI